MPWLLRTLAAVAACHAAGRIDYAPLAAKNGPLMYANARGPPKPWSRATVTAASPNHFRTLINFVHNYRKQRSGIPLRVAAPESNSTRRRLDGVPVG